MNATAAEMSQAQAMDTVIELTEDEMAALEAAKVQRQQLLDNLGMELEKWKEEAVTARRETENRWLEDLRQYHAAPAELPDTKDESGTRTIAADEYRRTNDNITRSKVLLVAARLGDMLFPTNDANWDLAASPSPRLPPGLVPTTDEQGQPLPKEQIAAATKERAKEAAQAMKTEVQDNLAECDYPMHGRAAIFQAALLGTGVLKGPFTKARRVPVWAQDGSQSKGYEDGNAPAASFVDVWAFYPQPSRNMDECEHVFELHLMTKSKVRKLARQPGFDPAQVNKLLDQEPEHGALALGGVANVRGTMGRNNAALYLPGRYPVWQYTGPIPKDALIAFVTGLALAEQVPPEAVAEIRQKMEADNLKQIDAEIWMSQGIVLKAMLRPVDDCDGLGYYVFNYEAEPDDIFGYGVPYLCRDDAVAANMVWHAIMLNTMMSSGPQIGVRKSALEPVRGQAHNLSCTKPKVWVMTDEVVNINEALSVFNIPNVVGRMMPVYERIKANADEHTMMPAVAQGEPTQGVPTTGGMAMLMNASNVVMRRLAKQWDDNVTNKMIPEFVLWNEQNNPKEEIRGDFNVIAKGASHLLIKDIQAQHIQFATQLFTSNALLQPYMKAGQWARANIDILELSGMDMLNTDKEVADQQAQQAQQENPEVLKAQALQKQAEAAAIRAEAEARAKDADIAFRKHDRALDHAEKMTELRIRESTMAMQLQAARFGYLHKLAALDSKERIEMARIEKDLNIADADAQLRKYGIDFQGQLDAEGLAQDERKTATEIAVEAPNPRLA